MANIIDRAAAKRQTLVLITHRFQGLDRMDEIRLMVAGQMVESGTHHFLLKVKGLYQRLSGASLPLTP